MVVDRTSNAKRYGAIAAVVGLTVLCAVSLSANNTDISTDANLISDSALDQANQLNLDQDTAPASMVEQSRSSYLAIWRIRRTCYRSCRRKLPYGKRRACYKSCRNTPLEKKLKEKMMKRRRRRKQMLKRIRKKMMKRRRRKRMKCYKSCNQTKQGRVCYRSCNRKWGTRRRRRRRRFVSVEFAKRRTCDRSCRRKFPHGKRRACYKSCRKTYLKDMMKRRRRREQMMKRQRVSRIFWARRRQCMKSCRKLSRANGKRQACYKSCRVTIPNPFTRLEEESSEEESSEEEDDEEGAKLEEESSEEDQTDEKEESVEKPSVEVKK